MNALISTKLNTQVWGQKRYPHQTSLSLIITQSLPKFMSSESVMASNHLILCHPFLLLPSIWPRVRILSKELAIHIRWPKHWSFSFIHIDIYAIVPLCIYRGFPGSSAGKEFACNAGDPGSISGSGRSPGERVDYPLQYSWVEMIFMVCNKQDLLQSLE